MGTANYQWSGSFFKSRICAFVIILQPSVLLQIKSLAVLWYMRAFACLTISLSLYYCAYVDYLNLKSNERLMFIGQKDDGSSDCMAVKVSP